MTEFDAEAHLVRGDAADARGWVRDSALPEDQKALLTSFIDRFPSVTFVKEDEELLDHRAHVDAVELPGWFREVRSTLAFVEPAETLFLLEDFEWYHSPRSDDVEDIWYRMSPGYAGPEHRALLHDDAKVYQLGAEDGTDEACLGIDLDDDGDHRILDFAAEDLMDNKHAGRPVRGSLYAVFGSYAAMLAHVSALRLPDGTEIVAEG